MNLLQRTCLAVALVLSPLAGCGDDDEGKKPAAECGNGKVDNLEDGAAAEECDGDDLNGASCATATMNSTSTGMLKCSASCTFDISGCSTPSTGGTGGGGSGGASGGGMGGMSGGGMGGMATGGTGGGATGGTGGGADAAPPDASTDASTEGGPGGPGGGGPP